MSHQRAASVILKDRREHDYIQKIDIQYIPEILVFKDKFLKDNVYKVTFTLQMYLIN
jgi:hypothetical protein